MTIAMPESPAVTELVQLLALATRVMNEHTNDEGRCVICGSAWPCGRVLLAERTVAYL